MLTLTGFEYGNSRLRARRARLLDAATLERMLSLDLDGLAAALADTPYRGALERASVHGPRAARVHEAVRLHQAEELEAMRSFYADEPRRLVDLAVSHVDLHNALVLVRAAVHGGDDREAAVAHLVPAGAVTDALAREILRQPDADVAVSLLERWRLPSPVLAQALRRAWPTYERTGELGPVEHALVAAQLESTATAASVRGGEELERVVRREIDERNVVLVLRALGSDHVPALLPGGEVDAHELAHAASGGGRDGAAAIVSALDHDGRWRRPLERWAATGETAELEEDLERERRLDAVALLHRTDPLGLGVPVAYEAALDLEARNLRLLAERAQRGTDPALVRPLLILPDWST